MQYLVQKTQNKIVLKISEIVLVKLTVQWNTKCKTRSLLSGSFSQVAQKFSVALNAHFIYNNSVLTLSPQFDHTQSARGYKKKFGIFSSLSLWP